MKEQKLRYIAYMRKSTEGDERQALSMGKQEDSIKEAFPDLNIIDWVKESKSAFKAENRPVFDSVLERIKNGEADGIVAWKSNRLSRNALDAGKVVHYINTGIIKDVKFARENFENTPEGIRTLQYALADSNCYSATLAVDVKEGNQRKRKLGWLTQASFSGYMDIKNPRRYEDGQPEHTTGIDPDRFYLLQKAWGLLLTGEYSVPAILKILNDQWGYRTRITPNGGGKPLSRAALYKIFNNIRYAGMIPDPITGKLLKGAYEPMITIEQYNLAQSILGKRGKPRLTQKQDFVFKGIATCGECGCNITAEHKYRGKNHYVYYHCTHKRKDYKCKQPCIEEKELIKQFEEFFEKHTIIKEFEEWGLEAIRQMNDEESGNRQNKIDTQLGLISQAEKRADNLLNLAADGHIDGETYAKKNKEAQEEIKRLRAELDSVIENGNDWRKAMEHTLEVLFSGREKFENGDLTAKREVLQSLGSNITLKDKKLTINTYKWLVPIENEYKILEKQFMEGSNNNLRGENAINDTIRPRWRRVRDSNPRYRLPRTNDLANRPLQPLG